MIIRPYTKNRLLYNLLSLIHSQFSLQLKLWPISILTLLFLTVNSYSQSSFGVSGTVTDNAGAPLSGVSVSLKNASIGTSTDLSGRFNLTVPNANGLLVFTYVGYTMQEIPIKNRTNISVQLVTAAKSLDDVVVVGYGTQRKSDLTGSVVSLRKEDFNKGVTTSVAQLIQGRAPGVQVTQSSGAPGGGVSIRIRLQFYKCRKRTIVCYRWFAY